MNIYQHIKRTKGKDKGKEQEEGKLRKEELFN